MDVRIFTDPSNGATYRDLIESAQLTEQFGYAGFFLSDHYLAFAGDGAPGPTDVWTTLAGLSRETSHIRLGPLVSSVTFRHPGSLAIIVAQVDEMSDGRLDFGIGAGYFEPEHRATSIPFPSAGERFDRLEEALELITGLWKSPVGQSYSFCGNHYQVVDSPGLPKPRQQPGPPIILGGTGRKRTPAVAARFADEFNLQTNRRRAPGEHRRSELRSDEVAGQIERVRDAAAAIGRDTGDIVFSMTAMVGVGRHADDALDPVHFDSQLFDGTVVSGSANQIVDQLGPYLELGITRLYVRAPTTMGKLIGNFETLAGEVVPQLSGC